MKILFHDTETTGVGIEDRILQSAYSLYELKGDKISFIRYMEEDIMPPVPIKPAAAATHGLWYDDLKDAPIFENSKTKVDLLSFIEDKDCFYCAHNSKFDIGMLEKEGIIFPDERIIDTLKIARHVNIDNADIESNSLQYLRYFFDFDRQPEFRTFLNDYNIEKLVPHTALSDIAVLAYYFKKLLDNGQISGIEDGLMYTLTPVPEKNIKFGAVFDHGTPFSVVATSTYEQYGKKKAGLSYLAWAINGMDTMSADVKIGMSEAILREVQAGNISYNNPDLPYFKSICATFSIEMRAFLAEKGYNIDIEKKVIQKIKDNITFIEENNLTDQKREYQSLKDFVKYYSYISKLY